MNGLNTNLKIKEGTKKMNATDIDDYGSKGEYEQENSLHGIHFLGYQNFTCIHAKKLLLYPCIRVLLIDPSKGCITKSGLSWF